MAYLLAYAKRMGCFEFDFQDFRLGVPEAYAPTYYHTGLFGENFVMDIPDLPLLLKVLNNFESQLDLLAGISPIAERYCYERGMRATYVERYLRCMDNYLRSIASQLAGVRFVGLSTWTSNFLSTLLFAAHLKRLRKPPTVVLGGPQVTQSRASAALALRSQLADAVVVGEGEAALLDLYSKSDGNRCRDGAPTPGTAILASEGSILYGPHRQLLRSEEIPVPTFDQMSLVSYQQGGALSVPFHLSRGCTDRCVFCSEWTFWERFRPGEALQAIEGVKVLKAEYGAEHIAFTDSLVNGHPGQLRQFAECLIDENINVRWDGFMRARMDSDTAQLLKRSGCESVFVGIESMSNETLALMKKRRTEENNMSALHAFLQAGIHVIAGLIPGFPKDDRTAFRHTATRLHELQQSYRGLLRVNSEPFMVSPGQPIYSRLDEFGLVGKPWDEQTIDIAPQYGDITQQVLCAIEGSNQGSERIGRLRIAEAMESDAAVREDFFDYKGDEYLNVSSFEFEHVHRGWFIARLKSNSGSIFALILTEKEKDEIEGLEGDVDWDGLNASCKAIGILDAIAKRHLISPSENPQLVTGGYFCSLSAGTQYRLSPLVVARVGDWSLKGRLLVVDYFTLSWMLLPSWQTRLIETLRQGSVTIKAIMESLRAESAISERSLKRAMQALVAEGMVLVTREPAKISEKIDSKQISELCAQPPEAISETTIPGH
ncbi:B12-binding domain-containing radical SAM protein [Bradyrhizobium sp. DASA03076]|uniref:B12-binding domain-containing radical SAM protein n=1 Tax=Bradyrhizobium sp. BLXBL-03 TaxID=3395916 RepID=UPI003F7238FF